MTPPLTATIKEHASERRIAKKKSAVEDTISGSPRNNLALCAHDQSTLVYLPLRIRIEGVMRYRGRAFANGVLETK